MKQLPSSPLSLALQQLVPQGTGSLLLQPIKSLLWLGDKCQELQRWGGALRVLGG